MEYFGFVLVAIVVFIIIYRRHDNEQMRTTAQTQQKQRRKELIAEYLHHHPRITNHEVRELFRVSDATATRYFDELEAEGQIKQIGEHGRDVYYVLK